MGKVIKLKFGGKETPKEISPLVSLMNYSKAFITLRSGLNGNKAHTMEEIAKIWGVPIQFVERIKEWADRHNLSA